VFFSAWHCLWWSWFDWLIRHFRYFILHFSPKKKKAIGVLQYFYCLAREYLIWRWSMELCAESPVLLVSRSSSRSLTHSTISSRHGWSCILLSFDLLCFSRSLWMGWGWRFCAFCRITLQSNVCFCFTLTVIVGNVLNLLHEQAHYVDLCGINLRKVCSAHASVSWWAP
jgi:hypothetical protein